MSRSRAGILAGASACILSYGTRKSTMGDIARVGGVAKATLYNHFRDKRELYAALVAAEVDAMIGACTAAYAASTGDALADGLAAAAGRVTGHPVLRRIADSEPAVLGALLLMHDGAPPWRQARAYAASLVQPAGPARSDSEAGDLVLRWVVAHACWPASAAQVESGAIAIAASARLLATTRTAADREAERGEAGAEVAPEMAAGQP